MIVSSRIVKPHIVKKWASPATGFWRSFRCPATSDSSARSGRDVPEPASVGLTDLTRRRRKENRWPARARARTVTVKPMAILTASPPEGSGQSEATDQRRKFSKYRLGVGPRWPWYFEPRPWEP